MYLQRSLIISRKEVYEVSELSEILLIYYDTNGKIPVNGPGAVVYNIAKNWYKKGVKFKEIPVNTSNICSIIKLIKQILISKGKIINIHSYGSKIPMIILILSKINRKNTYYYTVHGSEYLQSLKTGQKMSKYKYTIENILISNYENIICVSELQMIDLKRNFNIRGNISYVNNGYDVKYIEEKSNNKKCKESIKLLLAGGINRNKGILESLQIIKYLKDNIKNKDIIFNIIGGCIDKDYIEFMEYVKVNNLEENIKYLGFIDDKLEVTKLYLESDFVLSLSYYDTFNVSVIEALSLGIPVIVSNTTGASKFIDNYKNGVIVDLKNIELEKIKEYIQSEDCELIKKRIMICKESVKNLTWDNTAKNYLDLLIK